MGFVYIFALHPFILPFLITVFIKRSKLRGICPAEIKTRSRIAPLLTRGVSVLQDRYVQTVDAYVPDGDWAHNKALSRLMSPFFLKPDIYVNLTASVPVLAERLSKINDIVY